jgi:hypothetical protein
VINFQLSDRSDGGRIQVNVGRYETRVDGIEEFTGLALGPNGQPLLGPDANRNGNGDIFQTTTTGRDDKRSDGTTITVAGIVGVPLGADGHLNLSAEYQDRNPTNRTGFDPRRHIRGWQTATSIRASSPLIASATVTAMRRPRTSRSSSTPACRSPRAPSSTASRAMAGARARAAPFTGPPRTRAISRASIRTASCR